MSYDDNGATNFTNGTDVTADYANGGAITATGGNTGIDPLVKGTSFTAIVAPVKYDANDKFMTFTVAGQDMTVFAKNGTLTDGLEPGKHYTFDLAVSKDKVTLTPATTDTNFPGGWNNEDNLN